MACEALHRLINVKQDQPLVLLLLEKISQMPACVPSAQLERDCCKIINLILSHITKENLNNVWDVVKKLDVVDFFMPTIVRKFEIRNVRCFLLLLQWALGDRFMSKNTLCCLVHTLVRALEEHLLLDSLQALYLWASAKFVKDEMRNDSELDFLGHELFVVALDKLAKRKSGLFQLYQQYIEGKSQHNLKSLHTQFPHLRTIVPEFITWYFDEDDSVKSLNILSAARSVTPNEHGGNFSSNLRHLMLIKNDQ